MAKPTRLHMAVAKRVLRYLKGTLEYGIRYTPHDQDEGLVGFTDSDYAGDINDRRSTSGYVFFWLEGLSLRHPGSSMWLPC
ncbi:unnamed protein product [Linum tenue]|uniref:Uncharacterized protein n=1 Tax=Linum tenue TaxID=586396 RepID=A0AAV0Q5Z4_9ROSI|nr:unnamed protein product [Linum tenue]